MCKSVEYSVKIALWSVNRQVQGVPTPNELMLYQGRFQDLLNDVDKEVVMSDIKKWLDRRLAAAAQGGTAS